MGGPLTIIDAIKSGKRFRRSGKDWTWLDPEDGKSLPINNIYHHDILAGDWEIEEEKIEITRSQLADAYRFAKELSQRKGVSLLNILCSQLGFQ